MSRFQDLTNRTYGQWKVVGDSPVREGKATFWLCQCSCGTIKLVRASGLQRGGTKSCGCWRLKHGLSRSLTYRVWMSAKQRCYNPDDHAFARYGGRGIKVCERWLNSFEQFLADMGEKPKGLTLERIDNSGNYEPENCKWATQKEQCRNTRKNRIIDFDGLQLCLTEWSERFGYSAPTGLWVMLKRGKTMREIALRRGYYG